ncbi:MULTISPECIES: LacI family DNA-binding transcriptional regulator [Bifidobacterium]|uniref:LacI family DNA-binding transcriptional regulator n=1 Tax=Bifidobacterium TaxID=1678 RepID=UPI0018DC031E|nr:LacI family DNA-binding transcriptional regulator [Bifidobacterium asteroides]MBI0099608.1 LacI family DNA-binding transcriptional regulator [Bifidobacterium sp. W8114]
MDKVVTISDVAQAAGVSKATVSYVLSNDKRISKQTAEKVRRTINDLGYTVNHAARALSTKKSNVLGIVSPTHHGVYLSSFFGLHIYLLSEYATRSGYDSMFIGSDDGCDAMKKAAASHKVDGFILMDVCDNDPRMTTAKEIGIPTVVFGSPISSFGLDTVDSDFRSEAARCMQCMAADNHQEVILYSWSKSIFEKRMGFALRFRDQITQSAKDLGIILHIYSPDNDESDPAGELLHALHLYPHATAMIIHNESASIIAPQAFSARGIQIPDDLYVISVFPKQMQWSVLASFAFIQTDIDQLAQKIVSTLVARIQDPDAPITKSLLDFTLQQQVSKQH